MWGLECLRLRLKHIIFRTTSSARSPHVWLLEFSLLNLQTHLFGGLKFETIVRHVWHIHVDKDLFYVYFLMTPFTNVKLYVSISSTLLWFVAMISVKLVINYSCHHNMSPMYYLVLTKTDQPLITMNNHQPCVTTMLSIN